MKLYPTALLVGPDADTGNARIDVVIAGGHTLSIVLDIAHARSIASRIDEVISGRVMARPASRRVLQIALYNADEVAETEPPMDLASGDGR